MFYCSRHLLSSSVSLLSHPYDPCYGLGASGKSAFLLSQLHRAAADLHSSGKHAAFPAASDPQVWASGGMSGVPLLSQPCGGMADQGSTFPCYLRLMEWVWASGERGGIMLPLVPHYQGQDKGQHVSLSEVKHLSHDTLQHS